MLIEYLYKTTGTYLLYSRLFSTGVATAIAFTLAILLLPPYIRFLRRFHLSAEFQSNDRPTEPVMPAGLATMVSAAWAR